MYGCNIKQKAYDYFRDYQPAHVTLYNLDHAARQAGYFREADPIFSEQRYNDACQHAKTLRQIIKERYQDDL